MSRPNEIRNKQLVQLRDKNPKTYSYRELSRIFRLDVSTVHEIYHREKKRLAKKGRIKAK